MPKSTSSSPAAAKTVYRFEVRLLSGPFALPKGQRRPLRVIDIRGNQTLDALHAAIDDAFDRDDDHLFEFQIGGKKPKDRGAVPYGWPERGGEDRRDARATKIASLGLEIGHFFFYLFDFGDEWMHRVRLEEIMPAEPGAKYPVVVKRQGDSPPRYGDGAGAAEEDAPADGTPAERPDATPENDEGPDKISAADRRKARAELKAVFAALKREPVHDFERLLDIFSPAATFCRRRLNADYAAVCGNLMLNMDQLSELPLAKGGADIWAAGMVHALGFINDLEDPAAGEPTMRLSDIAPHFGLAASTMASKSREIRRGLGVRQGKPAAFRVNPPPEGEEQGEVA